MRLPRRLAMTHTGLPRRLAMTHTGLPRRLAMTQAGLSRLALNLIRWISTLLSKSHTLNYCVFLSTTHVGVVGRANNENSKMLFNNDRRNFRFLHYVVEIREIFFHYGL